MDNFDFCCSLLDNSFWWWLKFGVDISLHNIHYRTLI
jgi:hypothetical protein